MSSHAESHEAQSWSRLVTRILAPNPGPMTGLGTNTYVLRHPTSAGTVVVDPGPGDVGHVGRILALGRVDLILLTHRHADHSEGAAALSHTTGAPVRAVDAAQAAGAPPLVDDEVISVGGCRIQVMLTPGHTADSACFSIPEDRSPTTAQDGTLLTGDTLLGGRSTVIASPDGHLGRYFTSLYRMRRLGGVPAFPGHGPAISDLARSVDSQLEHRRRRLDEVVLALKKSGRTPDLADSTVDFVVERVYGDVAPALRLAATASTRAQLKYLADLMPIA